jgi:SAM-dependent methyltransferase
MDTPCRICGNTSGNSSMIASERMFGSGESFEYFECRACGCVQIAEIPTDPGRYYPEGYYSFYGRKSTIQAKVRRFVKRRMVLHGLGVKTGIGKLLCACIGIPDEAVWIRNANLPPKPAILDVGCGAGDLLLLLRESGFDRCTGADPHVREDLAYPNGVRILKKSIEALDGVYDFIMFHHSFEHMPDPDLTLRAVRSRLTPNGLALFRIPLASSFAWREYGTCWVQWDPPRHLYLHSLRSMEILAERAGLRIERIDFDSTDFQFWGSEQYRSGISLFDPRSYRVAPRRSMFTRAQIRAFRNKAAELNGRQQGDQACFYLRKTEGIARLPSPKNPDPYSACRGTQRIHHVIVDPPHA